MGERKWSARTWVVRGDSHRGNTSQGTEQQKQECRAGESRGGQGRARQVREGQGREGEGRGSRPQAAELSAERLDASSQGVVDILLTMAFQRTAAGHVLFAPLEPYLCLASVPPPWAGAGGEFSHCAHETQSSLAKPSVRERGLGQHGTAHRLQGLTPVYCNEKLDIYVLLNYLPNVMQAVYSRARH